MWAISAGAVEKFYFIPVSFSTRLGKTSSVRCSSVVPDWSFGIAGGRRFSVDFRAALKGGLKRSMPCAAFTRQ